MEQNVTEDLHNKTICISAKSFKPPLKHELKRINQSIQHDQCWIEAEFLIYFYYDQRFIW